MMLSQLAPHRLAAQPSVRRSLKMAEGSGGGAACPHGLGEHCEECQDAAGEDGNGSMKEVASLQVGVGGFPVLIGCAVGGCCAVMVCARIQVCAQKQSGGMAAPLNDPPANRPAARPTRPNHVKDMASLVGDEDGMDDDDSSSVNYDSSNGGGATNRFLELRCVLAVIRHGDRTPKQKMKMPVSQPAMLELFQKHKDAKGKQAKLKSPAQLQELLDVTRQLLAEMERRQREGAEGGSSAGEEERDQLVRFCFC